MATLIFIVLAPLIGLIIGLGLMVAVSWIFKSAAPRTVDKLFRKLQLLSAAAYSLGHGGNDAQKTMGIIAGALLAGAISRRHNFRPDGEITSGTIILGANAAIALGTYMGGWRIVHTMGSKITKLRPSVDSALKARAPLRSSCWHITAFPSVPRTPSLARSSAWGPLRVFLPCAGRSQTNCYGPGY